MKKGILILWVLLQALTSDGQNLFGNEWIRPDQPYIKLSTDRAAIYRLSYQDIQAADSSLLRTNPANWQLFFRGQEVAIRVVGQQDGVFNPQDVIEFYGEGNDGSPDSVLYRPQKRLHPYQTLFSDVAAYFLTVNSSATGKRVSETTFLVPGLSPEKFHVEETVKAFTSDYTFNNLKGIEPALQQSYMEPGEGWSGKILTADSVGVVQVKLANRAVTDWPVRLEGMINGRDNQFHRIQVQLENDPQTPLVSLTFAGFLSQTFQATINPAAIRNEQLTLRFQPEKSGTNQFSITHVKVTYPQSFSMGGQATKVFHLVPNPRQTSLLVIPDVLPGTLAYDITDKANCRYLPVQRQNDRIQVVVGETAGRRDILLTSEVLKPLRIQRVRFRASFPTSSDYLIITHASLQQSATIYRDYRASAAGGGHRVLVVEADSLYDQFNYGDRSPLALRHFAHFMLATTAVKTMLLIGKATSYPYFVKTAPDDLVPTMGYPGSDILLTAGLMNFPPNTPAIPTGRLSVTTNEQVLAYLAKVKEHEISTTNGLWRKNSIHISGGKSENEALGLRSAMEGLTRLQTQGQLGGEVKSFSKSSPYEKVESINMAPIVNEGVGLITFFGHAGPAITDLNFGYASLPQNGFRNQLYPFMIFNGCGVGEIFSRFNTLSADWLLAPEKGAVVVLAHSYYSYQQPTTRYLTRLYSELSMNPSTLGMPFGKVQQQVNKVMEKEGIGAFDISVMHQMVLQGDPALVLYPLPAPDFAVDEKELYIRSAVAGSALRNSDSVRVIIPLANLGKFVADQMVTLKLTKTTGTGSTSTLLQFNAFRYRDTLVYTFLRDEKLLKIDLAIDPEQRISELSRVNNTATLRIDWAQAGTGNSYPLHALPDRVAPTLLVLINGVVKENQAVLGTNPELYISLLDENPLSSNDPDALEVYLTPCDMCDPVRILPKDLVFTQVSANQLRVTTRLDLKAGTSCQLLVFGKDAAGNRTQPPYVLHISVPDTDEPFTFRTYPNPATTFTKFELNLNGQEVPSAGRLTVYNPAGVPVYEDDFPVETGKNVVVWQSQAPGLYTYRLWLSWKDGRTETRTGKLIQLY